MNILYRVYHFEINSFVNAVISEEVSSQVF